MQYFLLLGAGFSRNWGGWLASEVFEYLLGCPEITSNVHLRRALWKSKGEGGFEQTLALVQVDRSLGESEREQAIHGFEAALTRMFDDMNSAGISTASRDCNPRCGAAHSPRRRAGRSPRLQACGCKVSAGRNYFFFAFLAFGLNTTRHSYFFLSSAAACLTDTERYRRTARRPEDFANT